MRLSQAMRIGATMIPKQAFGAAFKDGGACAFGAAMVASGCNTYTECAFARVVISQYRDLFHKKDNKCPECGDECAQFASIVSEHLNDKHKWTREAIADWLETVEIELYGEVPQETIRVELEMEA